MTGLRGRVDEVELFEQRGDPSLALGPTQVMQVSHELEVLGAREQIVDGRELTGQADQAAHGVRLAHHVVTADPHLAAVGTEQCGQDVDHRGLAGAVRAEQREYRTFRDEKVDAVEHHLLAERLAQSADLDRSLGEAAGCARSCCWCVAGCRHRH